jgi:hypothetical protein
VTGIDGGGHTERFGNFFSGRTMCSSGIRMYGDATGKSVKRRS